MSAAKKLTRRQWVGVVGTPVIGLYAATRSLRSGPYLSLQWCVDRYAEAARAFRKRDASELPWTEKIDSVTVTPCPSSPDNAVANASGAAWR